MGKESSRSSSSSSGGENNSNHQLYKRLKLDRDNSEYEEFFSTSEVNSSPSSSSSSFSSSAMPPPPPPPPPPLLSSALVSPVEDIHTITPTTTNIKTQAAFVNKLYKMLEDPETSELICWSTQGDLFSVSNPTAFSKTVLPQYFKHNNWQSFVRQLNMYGFHKVNDLIHSNLTNENQTWEFKHPNFRRGAVNDLQHIKRKSAKSQHSQQHHHPTQRQRQQQQQQQSSQLHHYNNTTKDKHIDVVKLEDLHEHNSSVMKHMLTIEQQLVGITKSCEQLFNEVIHLRSIVSKQQDAMQDLVDVVSSSTRAINCAYSKNSSSNNQLELRNAENLRAQVSKLKENQTLNSLGYNSESDASKGNTNWSSMASFSSSSSSSMSNNKHESIHNPNSLMFNSFPNDTTKQRKLSSFDSVQQHYQLGYHRLDNHHHHLNTNNSISTNSNNNHHFTESSSNHLDYINNNSSDDSHTSQPSSYDRESDSLSIQKSTKNKVLSSKMGFGKQSHMLNPIKGSSSQKPHNTTKYK